jgi:hypothetical protein
MASGPAERRLRSDAEIRLGDFDFDRISDIGELQSDSPKTPPADAEQPSVLDDRAPDRLPPKLEEHGGTDP